MANAFEYSMYCVSELPRFVEMLGEELEALGLGVVPLSALTEDQKKLVRKVKVTPTPDSR